MLKIYKWLDYIIKDQNTNEFIGWKVGTPENIKEDYEKDMTEEKEFEKNCIEELKKYGFEIKE